MAGRYRFFRAVPALVLAFGVAGCGFDHRREFETRAPKVPPLAQSATNGNGRAAAGNVQATDTRWVGPGLVVSAHGRALPDRVETGNAIKVGSGTLSPREIFALLSAQTKIPIKPPGPLPKAAQTGVGAVDPLDRPVVFQCDGGLSQCLSRVNAAIDFSWSYDGDVITIRRWQTRVFPLAVQSELKMGGNAKEGGDADALLGDIEANLKLMLGEEGEVSVLKKAGQVTVSTTAARMGNVELFMKTQNRLHAANISTSVRIIDLEIADNDDASVSLSTSFGKLLNRQPLVFQSLAGATSGLAGIISPERNPTGVSLAGHNTVDAVVGALNQRSRMVRSEGATIVTASDVSKVLRKRRQLPFIKKSTLTVSVAGAPPVRSKEWDVKEVGFELTLRPRMQVGGRVQVAFNIRADRIVSTISSKDASGEITDQQYVIDVSEAENQVTLSAGDVLVVGGYEVDGVSSRDAAPIDASLLPLGGSRHTDSTRIVSVILLQPNILASTPPLQGIAAEAMRGGDSVVGAE